MPLHTTLRPEAHFAVFDEMGNPVKSARITFVSYTKSFVSKYKLYEFKTNKYGKASISKKSFWQTIILAPDQGDFYQWSWCIDKDGYQAIYEHNLEEAEFSKEKRITLKASPSHAICNWVDREMEPYHFEIIEKSHNQKMKRTKNSWVLPERQNFGDSHTGATSPLI